MHIHVFYFHSTRFFRAGNEIAMYHPIWYTFIIQKIKIISVKNIAILFIVGNAYFQNLIRIIIVMIVQILFFLHWT
jgi:hypothetical protein